MEKWVVAAKRADFARIASTFGIDPVTARLIRNRDIVGDEAIRQYLYGTREDLRDPLAMKDVKPAVEILGKKIEEGRHIRIIGDYDIDGVMSTYILYQSLLGLGARADYTIPHRILDGYGINEHLIEAAREDGVDTIVTCDNGIAAADQIRRAKEMGMTVIVTDHHEVPFVEENGAPLWSVPIQTCPFESSCMLLTALLFVSILEWRLILFHSYLCFSYRIFVHRYMNIARCLHDNQCICAFR